MMPSKMALIVYGVAALCVIGFGIAVKKWRDDSKEFALAKVEWSKTLESKNRELADMAASVEKANAASNDYQDELARLEDERANTPVQSVRLCRSPTGYVPAPSPAAASSGPDEGWHDGIPHSARPDIEVGPDIGPALYALADKADQCAAQRDALIGWIKNR